MAAALEDVKAGLELVNTRAKNDPVWFARTILNIKTSAKEKARGVNWDLDPWQIELLESVADVERKISNLPTKYNHDGKNLITVRAMHGPGKTFGACAIMHWFNFCFYGTIVCTAPKEKQLKTRLWPTFRKIRNRAGAPYKDIIKVDSTKIVWCGDEDWVAHAETASEPENLAGYHSEHLLFIVDEASGVKEEMFPVIEGAVSTGRLVIILLIGNPTKTKGTFHDSHQRPIVSKNYYQIHVDLNKTKRVSKDWVKRMGDKYGVSSPIYKVRCLGEFADVGENQLIPLDWLIESRERELPEGGDGTIPRLRITVDVADGGEDETTVSATLIYETCILRLKMRRFSFETAKSPIKAAEAAADMAREFNYNAANGDDFVIDSLGVGAGTAGYLIKGGWPVVVYKGGAASDDTKQWRNRRTQSYMVCRNYHREGKVFYAEDFLDTEADWDDYYAQMTSVETKPGSERLEDLVTKQEMKNKGIKSPDLADNDAMVHATQTPTLTGASESSAESFGETMTSQESW